MRLRNLDLLRNKVKYASVYDGDKRIGFVKDVIPRVGWRGYISIIENQFGTEGEDFVRCPVCNVPLTNLSNHYKCFHKDEYGPLKEAFPNIATCAKNSRSSRELWIKKNCQGCSPDDAEKKYQQWRKDHNMNQGWGTGESNHNHRANSSEHDRKSRSPRCLEYYERMYPGKTKEEYEEMRNMFYQDISDKRDNSLCFEYYMEHYNVTEDEAREMLAERQRTNKPDVYIRNYGQELGLKLYRDKLLRWHSKMKTSEFELDMINMIFAWFELDESECMFAGNYKSENMGLLENIPDFIYEHKIIEFNGDYWHRNPKKFDPTKPANQKIYKRDERILEGYKKAGYEVLVIWEYDVYADFESVLKALENFFGLKRKSNS